MSCPSCQVGARRLPSFPLSYMPKSRTNLGFQNMQNITFLNGRFSVNHIGVANVDERSSSPAVVTDDTLQKHLSEHPALLEDFVLKHVSQEQIERWLIRKCKMDSEITNTSSGRENKPSLSRWKFCVHKDKRKLLDNLTHEIHQQKTKSSILYELSKNISQAVRACQFCLYLVDDSEKYLSSYSDDSSSEMIGPKQDIETATTISAYVARQKEMVFVTEILGDDRFPSGTGRDGTDLSVICHPIYLTTRKLFGVAEFVKTANTLPFGEEDAEIVSSYLSWGSIAVHYAEVAQRINSYSKSEQFVNNSIRNLLSNNKKKEGILGEIMEFAKEATQSSNYTVFELDEESKELYSTLTDLKNENDKPLQLRLHTDKGIAGHVMSTREIVDVKEAYTDPHFCRDTDLCTGYTTKTILASPLTNGDRFVGVIQLVNKQNGVYNEQDKDVIRLCTSFYKLATKFRQVKQDADRTSNEIAVLKELLEYHTRLKKMELSEVYAPKICVDLPDDFYKLSFDYYKNTSQFGMWFMKMAKDILDRCKVGYCEKTLVCFTATVKQHYRDISYHTWEHAFSVAHFMYILLQHVFDKFTPMEVVALIFACICHDLDHRGRNNAFMQRTGHPLSHLYKESVMENHHFYMCKYILQRKECDFFSSFDGVQRKELFELMRKAIIATDLLKSFDYRDKLKEIIVSGSFDWNCEEHRLLASCIMMTVSDLCASCKPWKIHKLSSAKVFKEFYDQADEEISLGITPISMFLNKSQLARNQIGFLNGIVIPCVNVLVPIMPVLKDIEKQIMCTSKRWEEEEAKIIGDPSGSLAIPGSSELRESSISFARYNCSGADAD